MWTMLVVYHFLSLFVFYWNESPFKDNHVYLVYLELSFAFDFFTYNRGFGKDQVSFPFQDKLFK